MNEKGTRLQGQFILALTLLLAGSAQANAKPTTILGFVEEAQESTDPPYAWRTNLRLAFTHDDAGWASICEMRPEGAIQSGCRFDDPQRKRSWKVIHRGKRVGDVSTQDWFDSTRYSSTGLLRITSTAPRVGARSAEFSGWATDSSYRPLVAILGEGPHASAPWRFRAGQPADFEKVWAGFRGIVPTIPQCGRSETDPIGPSVPIQPHDAEVFRVIESKMGERLIGIRVKAELAQNCLELGGFGSDVWYYAPPQAPARLLDGFPPESDGWAFSLVPIDIGDFDGDGTVEIVFWYAGYDEDGYVLYYDNFTRHAHFTWFYH